jgi:transcriptional regulator GlxA family with amidase domain
MAAGRPVSLSADLLNQRVLATKPLRVGFVLAPRFTLTAFAGFIDTLRLAADEGDQSAPVLCQWEVMCAAGEPPRSSCGVQVSPSAPLQQPSNYDYIVVVGGLLHGGQKVPVSIMQFLKAAALQQVPLVGVCTGSFVLARAGLMEDHVACVSWFHRQEFEAEFPHLRVISNQMFMRDRDRLTCAGGTSVVHLAAALIEQHVGRSHASKALRILIEQHSLPSRTLQPEPLLNAPITDSTVQKAMLRMEQDLRTPLLMTDLSQALGLSRRQLERRFQSTTGLSPAQYRMQLRLVRARWLLTNTDMPVQDIAAECGFSDATALARSGKKAWGASPSAMRIAS